MRVTGELAPIQMISGGDWFAVYELDGSFHAYPILCWIAVAQIEEDFRGKRDLSIYVAPWQSDSEGLTQEIEDPIAVLHASELPDELKVPRFTMSMLRAEVDRRARYRSAARERDGS